MTKEFTEANTRNWVELLPKVMDIYNNRSHKTIGMSPVEASDPRNDAIVSNNMYHEKKPKKAKQPRFHVGDQVRISRVKDVFDKGMEPNFSYMKYSKFKKYCRLNLLLTPLRITIVMSLKVASMNKNC